MSNPSALVQKLWNYCMRSDIAKSANKLLKQLIRVGCILPLAEALGIAHIFQACE
jgi:hypothetical protein